MPGELGRLGALSPARMAAVFAQQAGLHVPSCRWPDSERAISAAAAHLHGDDADAWHGGLRRATLWTGDFEGVVGHMAVGETYFFRDSALFEVPQGLVPVELRRSRGVPGRCGRIWSADCGTGEAPSRIAMFLERALPGAWREQVSVIARDINPRFLAHAERGVYGSRSFHTAPAGVMHYVARCRDGRFPIDSRLRFLALNVAQELYPHLSGGDPRSFCAKTARPRRSRAPCNARSASIRGS